jgi:hypothetical protein
VSKGKQNGALDRIELRTLGLDWTIGQLTILCLVAADENQAAQLVVDLERIAFPPGERSSSGLSFDTARDGTKRFDYWVSSSEGSLIITIDQVASDVPEAAVETLRVSGAVPIIFGYFSREEVDFLPPSEYSLYRSSIVVDGSTYNGKRPPQGFNWGSVMRAVQADLQMG